MTPKLDSEVQESNSQLKEPTLIESEPEEEESDDEPPSVARVTKPIDEFEDMKITADFVPEDNENEVVSNNGNATEVVQSKPISKIKSKKSLKYNKRTKNKQTKSSMFRWFIIGGYIESISKLPKISNSRNMVEKEIENQGKGVSKSNLSVKK